MSKIVILHGLGQTTKDWQVVVNYIKNDYQLIDLFEKNYLKKSKKRHTML